MKRFKPVLIVLGLLLCGLIWLWMGISVNLPPQRPIDQLEAARARWEEQRIDDYRMSISFGSFSFGGWYDITVHDGVIVERTPQTEGDYAYEQHLGNTFLASLDAYTMGNLFVFMQNQLADVPAPPLISVCGPEINESRYEIRYDETGYIREIAHTSCARFNLGGGLMCPALGDCSSTFRVRSFEVLH